MQNRRWLGVLVIGMACVVAVSGCKKRTRSGSGLADDNVGGVTGSGGYSDEALSERPGFGMSEYGVSEFAPVYFDYDSSQIGETERAKVVAVADRMRGMRSGGVIVEGHCDERGSADYNLALGERRALAVRAYLIGLGIDGARVQTKSYGEERPISMGHDESAWRQNRRAEFVFFEY